jgi:hypothetical protein
MTRVDASRRVRLPDMLVMDNGPEFSDRPLDTWTVSSRN